MALSGLIQGGFALIDSLGRWLVTSGGIGSSSYYFLEDHYVEGVYITAGTTGSEGGIIPINWVPTPNVDPLNTAGVDAFYAAGPALAGPIRIRRPVTYWSEISPNYWALSGLGSDQSTYPPIHASIGRP